MGRGSAITSTETETIRTMYLKGFKTAAIARKLKRSGPAVRRITKQIDTQPVLALDQVNVPTNVVTDMYTLDLINLVIKGNYSTTTKLELIATIVSGGTDGQRRSEQQGSDFSRSGRTEGNGTPRGFGKRESGDTEQTISGTGT